MDVDPMQAVEDAKSDNEESGATTSEQKENERRKSRLNNWVAITIALLATFMGICKVKDDNIVQAMQQAQADRIDSWSYYQARNVREEIASATVTQLRLSQSGAPPAQRAGYDKAIAEYQKQAEEQHTKKAQNMQDAKDAEKLYNAKNNHDDQFDLSDALLAIAISLLAVTSLTQKRWLFALAMVPTFFGILMGLAGLLAWNLHPDKLISLLS